ncbi:Formylmethanofuran--tetrahydromethanopterin N-formyltransferase [hydrothermal vent metagenome]|uniref:Formylmethanofuran--tetrahydromethanopterin N-formyltransferase n=1 Tax=hydrothermal vent metagenome TaxID=652676 RepID=A0A3B1CLU2_9ZZZZ
MKLNSVVIDNTFAEAFKMRYVRLLVTAIDAHWLQAAISASTGCATSIIGCTVEAGLESCTNETPDGRPGAFLLFFAREREILEKELIKRIGQTLLTCPTVSVFNGSSGGELANIGARLRYFGDGHETEGEAYGRNVWEIPVSEGKFIVETKISINEGVAGGVFLIMAKTQSAGLSAAKAAVEAIAPLPGTITPFPGGVCRAASRIGSKYPFLKASTNTKFVPSLGPTLPAEVTCVYEIVINGVDEPSVKAAMREGILSAVREPLITMISAPNFEGRLGSIKLHLHDIAG